MRFLLFSGVALILAATAGKAGPAAGFSAWLASYRAGAIARGLDAGAIDQTLDGSSYLDRVVALDRHQPDDSGVQTLFSDYLRRQLTPARIADGQKRAGASAALLQDIARRNGVPAEIIAAIWGMETNYGRVMGGFDLPSALATLAYDGRRPTLFTNELDALVRIVASGKFPRAQLKGSWAGAFGQAQFLPSSYLAYAVDGDGDGRIDLWNSRADSFASIANYLRRNGWQDDAPWGFRVGLPRAFDRAAVKNPVQPERCIRPLERHSRFLSVAQWKALGLRPLNAFWPDDKTELSLVEPDGAEGDAYLASRNYRAILDYNCSNFYALSVGLLADALRPALRP